MQERKRTLCSKPLSAWLNSLLSIIVSKRLLVSSLTGHDTPPLTSSITSMSTITLALLGSTSLFEEMTAKCVQGIIEGKVVELLALCRTGDVMVVDETRMAEILRVASELCQVSDFLVCCCDESCFGALILIK